MGSRLGTACHVTSCRGGSHCRTSTKLPRRGALLHFNQAAEPAVHTNAATQWRTLHSGLTTQKERASGLEGSGLVPSRASSSPMPRRDCTCEVSSVRHSRVGSRGAAGGAYARGPRLAGVNAVVGVHTRRTHTASKPRLCPPHPSPSCLRQRTQPLQQAIRKLPHLGRRLLQLLRLRAALCWRLVCYECWAGNSVAILGGSRRATEGNAGVSRRAG